MRKYYIQYYCHQLSPGEEEPRVDPGTLGVHPEIIQKLVEYGIVETGDRDLTVDQALRVLKVMRLRRNLGVNLPGAAIILELLERIEQLQAELRQFKGR